MGDELNFADPGRLAEVVQERLQRIARGGGAVLVGDIAEQVALRGPGEEDRDAAKMRVGHDLSRRGIVVARVEAVDEDEDVAVDADAAGDVRSELGAELVAVKLALAGENDVVLAVRLAP